MTDILTDAQRISKLAKHRLPRHIAIIMDGNGRWAKRHNLPRAEGHIRGAGVARDIATECKNLGVQYVSLYTFSIENWKRPAEEVDMLMGLFGHLLEVELDRLIAENIRFIHIGSRDGIPKQTLKQIDVCQQQTKDNTSLTLCLVLNYGGRAELQYACRQIAEKVKAGELTVDQITEQTISDHLYTAGLPDPDLLIRTAGELRVSNFLLWQISYAEFYVTPACSPEFTNDHLYKAILDYDARDRKYGDLSQRKQP